MRKLIASILLIAFLGQTFNQAWYYFAYLIEKKEYMKRCENKARPQLHCDGKCQLMKKIDEQQKKEHGLPPELKLAAKFEIISPGYLLHLTSLEINNKTGKHFLYNTGSPVDRSIPLFHPPDLA